MVGARIAIPYLRRALKTLNPVVKGYVSESLAVLGDAASRPAFERMTRSRNARIRMDGAAALYILGDREELSNVIEALTNSNHQNQCAAANNLAELTRPEDAPLAISGLQKAIAVEKNPARISDFKKAIRELRQL